MLNWSLSGCLKNNNENQPRGISRKHIRTFVSEFRKFDVPHEPLRTASTRCVLANFGYLRKLIYAKIFGVTSNFRNRSYDCFLKMPRGRFCRVCATFKHFSEAQICEINWRSVAFYLFRLRKSESIIFRCGDSDLDFADV